MNIFDLPFSILKEYATPAGQPSMCLTDSHQLVGFDRETGIVYAPPCDVAETHRIVRVFPLRPDVPRLDAICEAVAAPVGSLVQKDEEGPLSLVHYKIQPSGAAADGASHVRGYVVDVETGCIVSASQFGHTPIAIADDLPLVLDPASREVEIQITDTEGKPHHFDKRYTVLKKFFEGVALEVFFFGGKMYVRSRSKLDTSRSYFGGSDFFRTMYERAGGPTAEELFDTTKLYSPWQYSFILVDPALCLGTRQVVEAPYLVHIATTKLWSVDPAYCPYPAHQVDDSPKDVAAFASPELPSVVTQPFVHIPAHLSWPEAGHLLSCGHLQSELRQGEPLIAYEVDDLGVVSKIVKIYPSPYNKRLQTVPKGDAREVFYSLRHTIADLSIPRDAFFAEFPYRGSFSADQMRAALSHGAIYDLPVLPLPAYSSPAAELALRKNAVWLALLVASPLSRQVATASLLEDAQANAATLSEWFLANEPKLDLNDPKAKSKYGASLVSFVQRYRRVLSRRPKTSDSRARLLAEFLEKEEGLSLFHITNKVCGIVKTDRKFEMKRAAHAQAPAPA